jgi:hypothetical protein
MSVAVLFVLANSAAGLALPPIPPYVAEYYGGKPEYAKFSTAFSGLKMKCDTCHVPGADKKAKGHGLNDFGKAVHDNFKHKDFLAANLAKADPAEAAKAKKLIAEALAAAEALKNADGKLYGDLMKAGQLPGKN